MRWGTENQNPITQRVNPNAQTMPSTISSRKRSALENSESIGDSLTTRQCHTKTPRIYRHLSLKTLCLSLSLPPFPLPTLTRSQHPSLSPFPHSQRLSTQLHSPGLIFPLPTSQTDSDSFPLISVATSSCTFVLLLSNSSSYFLLPPTAFKALSCRFLLKLNCINSNNNLLHPLLPIY